MESPYRHFLEKVYFLSDLSFILPQKKLNLRKRGKNGQLGTP